MPQRVFAAALWLALAIAGLSALLPAGLPQSSATGSAFNPANTVVALRTASQQERAAVRLRRDDPSGGIPEQAPISTQFLTVAVPALLPAGPSVGDPISWLGATPLPRPWSRGPPAA